jgi:hypothetical protein
MFQESRCLQEKMNAMNINFVIEEKDGDYQWMTTERIAKSIETQTGYNVQFVQEVNQKGLTLFLRKSRERSEEENGKV